MPEPDWHTQCNEEITHLRTLVRELARALEHAMKQQVYMTGYAAANFYLPPDRVKAIKVLLTDPRVRGVLEKRKGLSKS